MTRFKMATDLSFGSVPALYRELYDIICPNMEELVDHDMFVKLLVKSGLPKHTLSQIWDCVENKHGCLTRNGLYKALALVALSQQGKAVNGKLLESYSDQELPKPNLGDMDDFKALSDCLRREKLPNLLGYKYDELCNFDLVKIALVPERKGLILKHVEYEVTSRRYRTTVLRRYNDFVAFQEVLVARFPYRMIARLPPKKMMGANREFIEVRRRALVRFVTLTIRHPVISGDSIVKYFLTFNGSDMQHKIKEHFRGFPDEFMTHDFALNAKDLVPLDTQNQFSVSREHVRRLLDCVSKLRDIAERMVQRATSYASDMLQLGRELSLLASDTAAVSTWACGGNTTWAELKKGFRPLAVEYMPLADKANAHAKAEERLVVGELSMYLDLLLAYKELCERHEKGVLHDHQRALSKMAQYKKRHMSAAVNGPSESETVDQLENRILKQENEIMNMENRNYFSLHCVQMETQLIHANMNSLYLSLNAMASEEATSHSELAVVWQHIQPLLGAIVTTDLRNGCASAASAAASAVSPVDDHAARFLNAG